MGAFSLEYLKKKGTKRFTFLEGGRKDVGEALVASYNQAEVKEEAKQPVVAVAENRLPRERRGRSHERSRS